MAFRHYAMMAKCHVENAMRLLSIKDTAARISVSRVTVWKMVKEGRFPKPVPVEGSRKAFVEGEIDAWIESRVAARDAAPAPAGEAA